MILKIETATKLQEFSQSDKLKFEIVDTGIDVTYTLTDEEILELVELEYGQTAQDVLELFKCILSKQLNLLLKLLRKKRMKKSQFKVGDEVVYKDSTPNSCYRNKLGVISKSKYGLVVKSEICDSDPAIENVRHLTKLEQVMK